MLYEHLDNLIALADTMAAAAITFNTGQGYEIFLKARHDFVSQVDTIKKAERILSYDDTH